jgi:hypothetical protein
VVQRSASGLQAGCCDVSRLLRHSMTFAIDEARRYIAKVRWQFAKTMPQWPHEYTVRHWRQELETEFVAFAELIRREGMVKPWPREAIRPRYHHAYLEVDGWEYWTMGEPIPETTVINRALVEQSERSEAQPLADPPA